MEPVTFQPRNCERPGVGHTLPIIHHISIPFLDPQNSDPFTNPSTKVNYFAVDFDLDVQVAACRLSRKILTSQPYRQVCSCPLPLFLFLRCERRVLADAGHYE